jgi:cell wall-associated NlpC family hydrolase
MTALDPRFNAYRSDLAAEALRDRVAAPRYVVGRPMQVARGVVPLRRRPEATAPQDSQLLAGEVVTLFHAAEGWAWVQNQADGYVGYLAEAALSPEIQRPSHWVATLRTFVFPEPDLKTVPLDHLPMTAQVTSLEDQDGFSRISSGGWVYSRHLVPLDHLEADYVATALRFLGAPYLWGGKESAGLDCSGLVQVSLARAGIKAPRDCDLQAESLGEALPWGSVDAAGGRRPSRGDLLFSPGHVVIALDAGQVLHANSHAMAVTIEELAALEARLAVEDPQGITGRRRPLGIPVPGI